MQSQEKARKKVSTLDTPKGQITSVRHDGNTTRQVDFSVQVIFSGDICVCHDHFDHGRNRQANERLFSAVLRRVREEHEFGFAVIGHDIDKLEIWRIP